MGIGFDQKRPGTPGRPEPLSLRREPDQFWRKTGLGAGREVPHVTVFDLGSTNGTVVDGRRVPEAELFDGTTVRIGNTDIVVRLTREER